MTGSTTENVTKLSFASEQMRVAELSWLPRLLSSDDSDRQWGVMMSITVSISAIQSHTPDVDTDEMSNSRHSVHRRWYFICIFPSSTVVSEMTYTVLSGTLNSTIPYHTIPSSTALIISNTSHNPIPLDQRTLLYTFGVYFQRAKRRGTMPAKLHTFYRQIGLPFLAPTSMSLTAWALSFLHRLSRRNAKRRRYLYVVPPTLVAQCRDIECSRTEKQL